MSDTYTPDAIDRRIMDILHDDGRASNRAIGRELELSEAAIRKRLKRLTESGLLSHSLLVDVAATNMRIFGWMYIEVMPSQLSAAYMVVAGMDRCSGCAMKTGTYNLLAHMYAKDQRTMTATIEELYRTPGVTRVHFRQVNKYPMHRHEYIVDTSEQEFRSWHGNVMHSEQG